MITNDDQENLLKVITNYKTTFQNQKEVLRKLITENNYIDYVNYSQKIFYDCEQIKLIDELYSKLSRQNNNIELKNKVIDMFISNIRDLDHKLKFEKEENIKSKTYANKLVKRVFNERIPKQFKVQKLPYYANNSSSRNVSSPFLTEETNFNYNFSKLGSLDIHINLEKSSINDMILAKAENFFQNNSYKNNSIDSTNRRIYEDNSKKPNTKFNSKSYKAKANDIVNYTIFKTGSFRKHDTKSLENNKILNFSKYAKEISQTSKKAKISIKSNNSLITKSKVHNKSTNFNSIDYNNISKYLL